MAIGRRQFITALGGAAAAWPLAARAQRTTMPVIGFLHGGSPEPNRSNVAAFSESLGESGYVDGKNLAIEYRWAAGQYDQLPELAAELVARPVALILAGGGDRSASAAKAATSTIPIVMIAGADPVREGLVSSLNRPGGNLTGATLFSSEMESKRLSLLHEAVPAAKTIAVLFNPTNQYAEQMGDVRETAHRIGVELTIFDASSESEFTGAFATMSEQKAGALLVGADPFFNSRRAQLIELAAQYRIPAIYQWREFALEGGLMSYGTVLADAYRQAGNYAGRILKGEKPDDLPVVQPTKYQLVINLKTAKALGLEISPTLSARADDVIE
jgi:putative tryptophan/tyrosine transport system substrate-binding protein